jgi:hypothetical protein
MKDQKKIVPKANAPNQFDQLTKIVSSRIFDPSVFHE